MPEEITAEAAQGFGVELRTTGQRGVVVSKAKAAKISNTTSTSTNDSTFYVHLEGGKNCY